MPTFLLSGFQPIVNNRTPQQLSAPRILAVINGNSGQIVLRGEARRNARSFDVWYAAPGATGVTAVFTNSRSMPIDDLTPGTMYSFKIRALGTLVRLQRLERHRDPYLHLNRGTGQPSIPPIAQINSRNWRNWRLIFER